jgi:alpha-glucosidase (family GH31 glycosyl hydrolase)
MRPVFLQYPQAESFYGNDRDFLFGADLFVAPVTSELLDAHAVSLPPGIGTSSVLPAPCHTQGAAQARPAPDTVPLYARAGAIVPMQPLVQHTGEQPVGPLQLQVYLPAIGEGGCAARCIRTMASARRSAGELSFVSAMPARCHGVVRRSMRKSPTMLMRHGGAMSN